MAVDVALPSGAPVGDLLPAIVGLVDDRVRPGGAAHRWRLDRPAGGSLAESLSLIDNGVRDGELLILTTDRAPMLGPVRRAACHEVLQTRAPASHVGEFLPGMVCVLATVLSAAALAWTAGSESATVNAIIAAVGATAAAAVTMATGYTTTSSLAVVSLACATGFLAVPSGPAAPNVFLAATAGASASLLMLRLSGRASPALTATTAFSLLAATVTLVAMPVAVVGAALSTAALALLALSPRLSVLAAGLGPDSWQGDLADRAVAGHALLSGLVAGCAAGAASGIVVVVGTDHAGPMAIAGAATFSSLVGTVLLLRARTYVDPIRQIVLCAAGLVSVIGCLYVALCTHREGVGPVAGALVVIGLYAVRRPRCGATVSRMINRLECVALAAVVPAACWVAGVYAVVGEFHLR